MRSVSFLKHHAATALLLAWAAATPARAGQLFAFNYSLPGTGPTPLPVSANGFFATTDLNAGSYTITGAWGNWNGVPITGIESPGAYGGNDNLLFASGPALDYQGVAFTVNGPGDDGSGNVNLYYDAGQGGYTENGVGIGGSQNFSTSPASPQPVYFGFGYSIPATDWAPMAVSAEGVLTALHTDAQIYQVSGISGTWNGVAILSLLAPGTFGMNDNILYGSDPYLSAYGLSFQVNGAGDDGAGNVNVMYAGGYTEYSESVDYTQTFNLVQLTPEPSVWWLVSTALVPIVLIGRRRRGHV